MWRIIFLIGICLVLGRADAQNKPMDELARQVQALFSAQKGVFALAFKDLQTGECLGILEKETFHAASRNCIVPLDPAVPSMRSFMK